MRGADHCLTKKSRDLSYNILSKDSRLQHLEGSANTALFGGLEADLH